ncbi:hypothetical protein AKJ09_06571 [Labilithrix luteola]|uniref:Uncharacterized protein n=1 Tax=Labilithrix luteola TaxID=1391654 RepID=A0A0K1Q2E8_9BACT|nr:hypothetical protein AKJ09_06571 [Labilithrix luteola]
MSDGRAPSRRHGSKCNTAVGDSNELEPRLVRIPLPEIG